MMREDETLAVIEKLERASRRSWPFMAFGLLAALAALIMLTVFLEREQRQAAEVAKLTAQARILQLRLDATLAQLKEAGVSPLLVSKAISQSDSFNASLARIERIEDRDLAVIDPPPVQPAGGVHTLTAGSPKGWDIDVFWCKGDAEKVNFTVARNAAVRLAAQSARKGDLAPGLALGRVRLRPMRVEDQLSFNKGFFTVADSGPGEAEAAAAASAFLTGKLGMKFERLFSRGDPTKYYLSVFACKAAAPPST